MTSGEGVALPANAVMIPQLCNTCGHVALAHELRIGEDGPWQLTLIAIQLLLFQRANADDALQKRLGEKPDHVAYNIVLAEIGCLACRYPEAFGKASRVLKRPAHVHGIDVATAKATDPNWPEEWQPKVKAS